MEARLRDQLRDIRDVLRKAASDEARASFRKFVPTSVMVYGARLPTVNELARRHKTGGFDLAVALWRSGAFEEQLLAAKILGFAARHDPERAISLVCELSSDIADWAVCDTLGMQSVKGIAAKSEDKLVEAARQLAKSSLMWQRRLSIVLLTHVAKEPSKRAEILGILRPLRLEKEHYVKKAIAWIDKDLG
jgi:3-methyladenine DNA glycosylase AlkD